MPVGPGIWHGGFRKGADEVKRPASALVWSAFAAGLSLGVSAVALAEIRRGF